MSTFSQRSRALILAGATLVGTLALASTAFAATIMVPTTAFARPAVVGTVASVSGNTLTVTAQTFRHLPPGAGITAPVSPTTYTVDATNAVVFKAGATSTVSAIAVGDRVVVQGTVSGTNVTATTIRDGLMGRGKMSGHTAAPFTITGNGEPVIGGKVTAISGSTLTVTNASNVTYAVTDSSATVVRRGVPTATTSSIAVGDNVVVQGTVNGTAVTASSIIDAGTATKHGAFGILKGFLSRIFGFF